MSIGAGHVTSELKITAPVTLCCTPPDYATYSALTASLLLLKQQAEQLALWQPTPR